MNMVIVRKLLMYLIYGLLIGVPAGLISGIALIPLYALLSVNGSMYLAVIGLAVSLMVLGWWGRFVVRKIHILGG